MMAPQDNTPPRPPQRVALDGPQTDLLQTATAFLDKAWIVALCVVVTTLAAALYVKRAPRIYKATATVQVEQQEQKVVKIEQVLQEDLRGLEILNTIAQKLRSRPLLARVVATNHLATNPRFLSAPAGAGVTATNTDGNTDDLVSRLEGMVKTSLRRNTRLIDVTVSHTDPQLSAVVANSIVGQFLGLDVELQTSSTKGAYGFLKDEADRLSKELETSERELQKYREKVGSVSVQLSQESVLPKLQQYNLRLTQARADTIRQKALYEQISRLTNQITDLLSLPQIATEAGVADSRAMYTKAQSDFATVQLRYKQRHPKYLLAASQVEESRKTLVQAALGYIETSRMAYEVALLTEQKLEVALKEAEQDALGLSSQAIDFNLLSREVESKRALLTSVLNRVQETSISSDRQSDKIRIVQPATPPPSPASPRTTLILGLALLIGFVCGAGLVLVLDAFDLSLRSVDEAESYLRLPVLTTIPRLKEVKRHPGFLVAAESEKSVGAESFRSLRTTLSMLGPAETHRSFLLTSAMPAEGKSFISLNLGAVLAQQGLRTLVIDADLRRPSIEESLSGEEGEHPGVTDYLIGGHRLEDLARTVPDHPCLSWIPAGKKAPNPAELLAQGGLAGLLEDALKQYDRVVVDSPPIHAVSDSLLIAKLVQTTIIVIHGNKTPRKIILRAVKLLEKAGARTGGAVLNLLPPHRGRGYYYQYDTYYYHGDYGRNGEKRRKKRRARARTETPDTAAASQPR